VFNASLVAAKELFNIFLVIALMTALLNALKVLRSDVRMVAPFRAVMRGGLSAYLVLSAVTYFISLFFWPTPAVPLVAAVLVPAAIAAGLPAMGAAVAVALAGQGMALSSDYVIGVAPGISARAAGAGVSAAMVADRALVLSLIVGLASLSLAWLAIRRDVRPASPALLDAWQRQSAGDLAPIEAQGSFDKAAMARGAELSDPAPPTPERERWSRIFAIATPIGFAVVVGLMLLPKLGLPLRELKGGEAAALVGGTAALLMIGATLAAEGAWATLEKSADHITDGFVFAFRAMAAVLPIAGFFFIGAGDTAAPILNLSGGNPPHLLFELIQSAQGVIPDNPFFVAFGVLLVGMITGIDGSGFAGLPLTGGLAGALGPAVAMHPATLAAVGQMGAVWTGGGTLIAWSSLIAVAGFTRVPVLAIVRVVLLPVLAGLALATLAAVVIWR
jgi:hypothetical protein